jgi:hypothetical protein
MDSRNVGNITIRRDINSTRDSNIFRESSCRKDSRNVNSRKKQKQQATAQTMTTAGAQGKPTAAITLGRVISNCRTSETLRRQHYQGHFEHQGCKQQ